MTPSQFLFSVWNKPRAARQRLMIVMRGRTLGKEKGGGENDCEI